MIAFSIGPLTVYWYGIMYLLSFVLGYIFLYYVGHKSVLQKKLPAIHVVLTKHLDDLLLVVVLWVIIGGRLGEVLFYQFSYYITYPLKIFAVWEWGMSFVGWFLWVMIAVVLFAKKKEIPRHELLGLFDVIVAFLPLAIIFGRLGNFLNQELYGLAVPSGSWWLSESIVSFLTKTHFFHVYPWVDNVLRINTNFLAMLFEWLMIFVVVQWFLWYHYAKKNMRPGVVVSIFMVLYGIVRFVLDYFRVDAQNGWFAGMSTTQWFGILFVVVGMGITCYGKKCCKS